jgi:hypothetical protein
MTRIIFCPILLLGAASAPDRLAAQCGPASPLRFAIPAAPTQFTVQEAPPETQALLKAIVLQTLPVDYENTRQWGGTRRMWDGLHVHMDGWRVKTKRRFKEANHGTWKKYRLTLVDPAQQLTIQLANVRQIEPGRIEFELTLGARVNAYGRLQEWNHDVRLFSVSADAIADVVLWIRGEMSSTLDPTKLPPDVLFQPVAHEARLNLVSLRLLRISKTDGPIVKGLGEALEEVIRDELSERSDQLVARINRQIQKDPDNLRFSLHDLVKYRWLGLEAEDREIRSQDD